MNHEFLKYEGPINVEMVGVSCIQNMYICDVNYSGAHNLIGCQIPLSSAEFHSEKFSSYRTIQINNIISVKGIVFIEIPVRCVHAFQIKIQY